MLRKNALYLAVMTLLISAPIASAAPILQVNSSGILTGATGVDVGGTLYDVLFVDNASCAALYSGCDEEADFFIDATAASHALLAQVLVDGPAGNFGSMPNLIFGCTDPSLCQVNTPDSLGPLPSTVFMSAAINFATGSGGTDHVSSGFVGITETLDGKATDVLAQWTPAAAVPEPASMTLLGIGLAGLGARRWGQRRN